MANHRQGGYLVFPLPFLETSILYPLSSILYPLSSILYPLSSILYPLSSILFLFDSKLQLNPLHVTSDLGQFFHGHEDAPLFAHRRGGRTEHALARCNFLGHACLGADDRPVADTNVIHNPSLAGNDNVITCAARA